VRKALFLAGSPDRDQRRRGRLVIVGKILEKDSIRLRFDAQNGEYVNLISKGIIDRPRSFGRPCRMRRRSPGF